MLIDIAKWVEDDSVYQKLEQRQAIHTILLAVALSHGMRNLMALKGGILLAIRYQGVRYTKDIDFSTNIQYLSCHSKNVRVFCHSEYVIS